MTPPMAVSIRLRVFRFIRRTSLLAPGGSGHGLPFPSCGHGRRARQGQRSLGMGE